jgi:hypothetical protein
MTTINDLTAHAQKSLVTSLESFGNVLSIPHKKTLYCLVESFMQMAHGKLQGRIAWGLGTGLGKTQAVIECNAALYHGGSPLSTVTCASRIDALCTMKRAMIAKGIPEASIGLMYAQPPKGLKYSEPRTEDNHTRQFLLVSHQRLRERIDHIHLYNSYLGKDRDLVIYDESLLVSDIEHFQAKLLAGCLGRWIGELKWTPMEHANILNWMNDWNLILDRAFLNYDADVVNFLEAPTDRITSDEAAKYEHLFRTGGDPMLADFLKIDGLPMRLVRRNGGEAVISFQIVIPEVLKNILVLDASYPIRTLEKNDPNLTNAEALPSCKAFNLEFSELKRFDNVTLYRMAHHGGRSSVANDKTKMKKLFQDVTSIINGIPEDEGILVFVYKPKNGKNPAKTLSEALAKISIELPLTKDGKIDTKSSVLPRLPTGEPRINVETWGNETSLNEYHYCKHVLLVGILYRDLTELEAQHLGQLNDLNRVVDLDDLLAISLSERVHLAYQALSRGFCRLMETVGQAGAMTSYIVEIEDGIETGLDCVMPGVTWKTWTPTYSDAVAHGRLVEDLAERVRRYLNKLPTEQVSISSRKLKTVLHADGVAPESWKRAVKRGLAEIPEWKRVVSQIHRVAA